jgi:spermidine/putrescine transport system substrate-binding protein
MKHVTAAMATLAAAAIVLSGCSKDDGKDSVDLSPRALAAATASGIDLSKGPIGGELHIYTWSDYIAPEVKSGFEKALGCTVVIDTFDSNESMYAKLKAGGSGYDIITPTSYQIGTMAKEKMIVPLDHAKIPNLKNFDRRFATQIIDPTFKYNIPYSVTYGGFLYVKDKIPSGVKVNSWSILSNPALKGRISLLDDIRETIGGALMSLGYSINSTNKDEIAAATAKLLEWRPNIRKFDAESYKTEVPAGASFLAHGYSTDSIQVIVGDEDEGLEPRPDIGFALPEEGFSIAFDEMVLSANAPRPDLAYAFMNYIYDGEVAKVNMEFICGPVPSKPGIDLLEEDYRRLIVLDEDTIRRGQVLRNFEDAPGVLELYNKAWDRIKATEER